MLRGRELGSKKTVPLVVPFVLLAPTLCTDDAIGAAIS